MCIYDWAQVLVKINLRSQKPSHDIGCALLWWRLTNMVNQLPVDQMAGMPARTPASKPQSFCPRLILK